MNENSKKPEKDNKRQDNAGNDQQGQPEDRSDNKKVAPQETGSSSSSSSSSSSPDITSIKSDPQKPIGDLLPPSKPEDKKEKQEKKEPWQENEDVQERLSKVSTGFSPQPLKEVPQEKSVSSSDVPLSGSQKEPKILSSVSQGSHFDVKKISHHPASLFILLGVVGFGLAALLFSVLVKRPAKKPVSKQAEEVVVAEMISPMDVVAQSQESLESDVDDSDEGVVASRPRPAISLSGIIFDEKKGGMALINGKIVREGYSVDGVKLERVFPDKVELSFEGKKFILRSR